MRHPRRHRAADNERKPRAPAKPHVIVPQQPTGRARYYKSPDRLGVVKFYLGKFEETTGADNRTLSPMPANVRRAFDEARKRQRKGRQ